MATAEPHEAFEALVGELEYPMLIVTAASGGERAGCLVGFATQSSIDPPRYLVCVSRRNRTHRVAERAAVLAVHFVPSDREDLAELFGGETGDEIDKFERCEWREGPEGAPIVDGCRNWFAGEVLARLDLGDHTGFLLRPFGGERGEPVDSFPFRRARWIAPGHDA
ncbi:MAG TPA: flavin reductase family protein [Solirubrobacterales bacterium]